MSPQASLATNRTQPGAFQASYVAAASGRKHDQTGGVGDRHAHSKMRMSLSILITECRVFLESNYYCFFLFFFFFLRFVSSNIRKIQETRGVFVCSDQQEWILSQLAHDDAPVDRLGLDGYTARVDAHGDAFRPDFVDKLTRLQAIAERVGVVADVCEAGEAEINLSLRRGQTAGDGDREYESAIQWRRMQRLQSKK